MTNSSGSAQDGVTLRVRLGEQGPLSLEEASLLLDQMAEIVDALPIRGLPYGVISPENVLLQRDGTIRLSSGRSSTEETRPAKRRGRIRPGGYPTPEELREEMPTPASDIWALGSLLYEALAGHAPFPAASSAGQPRQVLEQGPEPLPKSAACAQPVVDCALARLPADRYPSAQALANAFWEALPHPAPDTSHPARRTDRGPDVGHRTLGEAVDRPLRLTKEGKPAHPRPTFLKRFRRD